MRLYYCDLWPIIVAIRRDGFRDGDVWLSDTSLRDDADSGRSKDLAELMINAPDDELGRYEVIGPPGNASGSPRAWRVPAKTVNGWARWWAD